MAETQAKLFAPLRIRRITLPNRVMISPMCMYSAEQGRVNDFHLVHLGRYALGGAGLVMAEATAVEARGRISSGDAGLWADEQIAPWSRVAAFLKQNGAVPGIQLAHAGRKACSTYPWEGMQPLVGADSRTGETPWRVVGPTDEPAGSGWPAPEALTPAQIGDLVLAWRDAAARALAAGFEVIEIHGAHGYLIHSFLSPLSNRRNDDYGGDLAGRMRLALEIASAVREVWPERLPLFWRVSALDGIEGGWTMDDTVVLARALKERGVDVIDTSSGGIVTDPSTYSRMRRGYGYHTPYAAVIRREAGPLVATVGLIVDPLQAEGILARGEADIVAIGREALADPQWALRARAVLARESEGGDYAAWPRQVGWWLAQRSAILRRLDEAGDDPRVPRYETPAA